MDSYTVYESMEYQLDRNDSFFCLEVEKEVRSGVEKKLERTGKDLSSSYPLQTRQNDSRHHKTKASQGASTSYVKLNSYFDKVVTASFRLFQKYFVSQFEVHSMPKEKIARQTP